MNKKRRIHISLPGPLADALEALAELEGRAISDVIDDLVRSHLKERGLLNAPTQEQIQERTQEKKKKRK